LTRILIFYEYLIFARHATVLLLLGEEEEALGTTLYAIKVIVDVKEPYSEGETRDDDAVHLAGTIDVNGNDEDEGDLNPCESGHLGHGEALLNGVDFLGRLRGGVHGTFTVKWHFYYLLRK